MILSKDSSIAIIGAGLAGLAAGCYARINGYRSVIYELGPKAGGVACWWRQGPYLFDGGIRIIPDCRREGPFGRICAELGILDRISVRPVDILTRFVDPEGERHLDINSDTDALAVRMKGISPSDSRIVDRLASSVRALDGVETPSFGTDRPPELSRIADRAGAFRKVLRHWKLFTGDMAAPVRVFTAGMRDGWLRACVNNIHTPDVPAWYLVLILSMLRKGELATPAGGCESLVGALDSRYRELGGRIRFNCGVTGILHDDRTAFGVTLEDGSTISSDHVIAAADGYTVLYKMLGDRQPGARVDHRYSRWRTGAPLVRVSMGVRKTFRDVPPSLTVIPDRGISFPGGSVESVRVRIFDAADRFAPRGRSVLQADIETGFDFWSELNATDRRSYLNKKKEAAAICLELLDGVLPGLADSVEIADVSTPQTLFRRTGNRAGSWCGWRADPVSMTTDMKRTVRGLSNLYLAGHWFVPGSVPTAMLSGRHAVQLACHADKKNFTDRKDDISLFR